jgi:ABC-type sulfate/molybdate transport systems ATPase subunit
MLVVCFQPSGGNRCTGTEILEPSLDLAFRRWLAGFELNVAWRTNARRLAILGASGSGKSMTLRLIAGLALYR